jgi:hypothetical protein
LRYGRGFDGTTRPVQALTPSGWDLPHGRRLRPDRVHRDALLVRGQEPGADIGTPPGYRHQSSNVRNPISLAIEFEPQLVVNIYVRDQPATDAEINREVTA